MVLHPVEEAHVIQIDSVRLVDPVIGWIILIPRCRHFLDNLSSPRIQADFFDARLVFGQVRGFTHVWVVEKSERLAIHELKRRHKSDELHAV